MHLWKNGIFSRVIWKSYAGKVVHLSETYWFMGEPRREKTTLFFLSRRRQVHVFVYPLVPLQVLACITASIVMDILRMTGKICKWMKGKLRNSASTNRPQVSSYIVTCLCPTNKEY
jgi:hypothetical protein